MDILLCVLAVFGLCAALTLWAKVPSGIAPLVALSTAGIWFTVAGVYDILLGAGWLFYLGCWGVGAVALFRQRKHWRKLVSCGSVLFWMLSAAFAVYFSLRQPMFSEFDAFSFWGTAAKMTSTSNHLFTICESGTPWQATQSPGLIVLSYFVQFFGEFAPHKVYLAYDMLLFACIAALVGALELAQSRLAVPVAVIGWCTPWFFTTYARTIFLNTVYLSVYGDIPAGMMMGGALALWLCMRTDAARQCRWAIFPVLAMQANIKDNTFPIALVTAGIIGADMFLFHVQERWGKDWYKRLAFAGGCLVAPLASYLFWSRYIGRLVAQNAAAGGTGETSVSPFSAALYGTQMLLGISVPEQYEQRREIFYTALSDMWDSFLGKTLSMVGSGAVIVALILAVFVVALVFAKNGFQRIRVGCWMLLTTLGYLAYSYVIALSYGFIFKPFQSQGLVDYNRYLSTYYIGWFMAAVAVLVWILRQGRWKLVGNLGVLAFACLMLVRVGSMVLPQFSVLGFSDAEYSDQHIMQGRVKTVQQYIQPDSRIFFVSQGDNGLRWFTYSCYFHPNILDYSGWTVEDGRFGGGGGTFGLPGEKPEGDSPAALYYHDYTKEEFFQLVEESGCDYIFVDALDQGFIDAYADLFADKLSQARAGETMLYQVSGEGWIPVQMEVQG